MTSWPNTLDHVTFPCPSLFLSMAQLKHPATHFWDSIHHFSSECLGVFASSPPVARDYSTSPAEFMNMNKHNSPQRWVPSGSCRCGPGRSRPVWSVLRWWPGYSGASGHGEPHGASAGSPDPGAADTSYPVGECNRKNKGGGGGYFVNNVRTQY